MLPSVAKDYHEMRQWKRPSKKAKLAPTTQKDTASVERGNDVEERWKEEGMSEKYISEERR